jgi:type 1 glutamine amidotransferase
VDLPAEDLAAVDAFVRSGGGMLALHTAVICFDGAPVWTELCGAAWNWQASSHPPVGPVEVRVTHAGRTHPVTAGDSDFVVDDELYRDLDLVDGLVPLLEGTRAGATHPVLWAREVGAGRVVTDLLGHGPGSIAHPVHRAVLGRAAAWIAGAGPGSPSEGGRR